MSHETEIPITVLDSETQRVEVYPRTEDDAIAEAKSAAVSDELFAKYAPQTVEQRVAESRVEPSLKNTLGKVGVRAKHFAELAGGNETSLDSQSVARRNKDRAKWGLGPES